MQQVGRDAHRFTNQQQRQDPGRGLTRDLSGSLAALKIEDDSIVSAPLKDLGSPTKPMTEEERKQAMAEAEARMKEAESKRKMVEYRVYYSDFKAVGGVKLPHKMQRSIDGKPTEELTFEQIKVNPKIDARKFEVTK